MRKRPNLEQSNFKLRENTFLKIYTLRLAVALKTEFPGQGQILTLNRYVIEGGLRWNQMVDKRQNLYQINIYKYGSAEETSKKKEDLKLLPRADSSGYSYP